MPMPAPFDGYVQKRMISLGEFVKSQTPVMSIVRVDPLKAAAEIPEKMAPWITVGQAVALQVDAYPGKTIAGKMSRISPAVNPSSRAFPFEALVPNPDALLKPGTFVRRRNVLEHKPSQCFDHLHHAKKILTNHSRSSASLPTQCLHQQ